MAAPEPPLSRGEPHGVEQTYLQRTRHNHRPRFLPARERQRVRRRYRAHRTRARAAGRRRRPAHRRLRPVLDADRRQARRPVVRRGPPLPPAEPVPVAGRPAEAARPRLQRDQHLRRPGTTTPPPPGSTTSPASATSTCSCAWPPRPACTSSLRPGPYINAEVDAGGFPGWLTATKGTARTSDPTYLAHVDEWLTAVDRIVARHLYTDGGGTVVLYQLENEYASHVTSPLGRDYMAHLYAKVRADGIDVPLFHNDKGRNGDLGPGHLRHRRREGRYLYGFDGYPSPFEPPPDWGYFGVGGTKGGSTASPDTPGFVRRVRRRLVRSVGRRRVRRARGTPSRAGRVTRRTSGASTSPTSPTASRSTTST